MKTLATIAILAGCTWASIFTYQSASADTYMHARLARMNEVDSRHLHVLHSHNMHSHAMQRVTDTAKNRAIYSASWVVSIGDGYLYSAW